MCLWWKGKSSIPKEIRGGSIHGTLFRGVSRPIDSFYCRNEVASSSVSDVDRYVIIRRLLYSVSSGLHLFKYRLGFQAHSHRTFSPLSLPAQGKTAWFIEGPGGYNGCGVEKNGSACAWRSECMESHIQFQTPSYICCQHFLRTLHNLTKFLNPNR
jgi:hypothetical protein